MDSGYSALSESGSTQSHKNSQKKQAVSIQTQTGESGGYTLPVKVYYNYSYSFPYNFLY